ncbi:protein eva-1 homolog C isoform X4 [Rhea pennata]|uniref:protein eva-1 homolog C isoform X4 n=1 Tax=Rhea pennata TaxID=8795 RepID=UPI002E268729
MREGDAGQHPRRGQVEPGRLLHLLSCVILVCSAEIAALTDFAGYLTKLLQNHTAYACDGEHLSLHCPRHSTISVQSAFYGQDYQMCSTLQPETRMTEPINCVAPTSLQKVLDECQNLRSCQLLVNSRVFGPDLCPGTTKFLLVSFKCKPNCLSYTALKVLSKRCYGKQRCKIIVTSQDFGSPCLPGVKKYLNVSYACVPKFILTAVDPLLTDSKPSVKQNDVVTGIDFDPRESRLPKKEGILVSNSLATFAYIRDHPERAALLFVSSVCVGLIFTLCALVIRVSCSNDFQKLHRKKDHLVPESDGAYENSENEEEEEEDSSDSDFPDEIAGLYRPSYSGYNSTEAADLAERIERREQIIQEIWMNSGLDMTPPRNMNTFYINEQ